MTFTSHVKKGGFKTKTSQPEQKIATSQWPSAGKLLFQAGEFVFSSATLAGNQRLFGNPILPGRMVFVGIYQLLRMRE